MKNKAFNQTVAFTSASMDFSQKEKEPKEDQIPDSSLEDENIDTNEEEVHREKQQLSAPVLHTPVPSPQVNITISHRLNSQNEYFPSEVEDHKSLENTLDSEKPNQKVYDRFKRTVEINTLELFDGDSSSTGAAWMIRDKDDVIEHRERLGLDNSEFYQESSKAKTIAIIVILASTIFALWYSFIGL